MKKILIFGYHAIIRDPRSYKQLKWLMNDYDVDVVCQIPDSSIDANYIIYNQVNFSYFKSKLRLIYLIFRRFNKYTWSKNHKKLTNILSKKTYDLIIVHHIKLLPLVFSFSGNTKVIMDAHEFYTEVYTDSVLWNFFMKKYYVWLSNNYLSKCDLLIAVNESMSKRYAKEYDIKTEFITNAAEYYDIEPSVIKKDEIKIIHHGLAGRSRKLELMIEMADFLDDRFTLTFLIFELNIFSKLYLNKLKRIAKHNPKIVFLKPVPADKLVEFGNQFDIGLFFMPPSNYNEEYSLANKVFQYIQSRLMLAVSPLPEMKNIVENYELGVIAKDYNPKSLAIDLNSLTSEAIMSFKAQSHKNSRKLSSIDNMKKFIKLIHALLN